MTQNDDKGVSKDIYSTAKPRLQFFSFKLFLKELEFVEDYRYVHGGDLHVSSALKKMGRSQLPRSWSYQQALASQHDAEIQTQFLCKGSSTCS